MLLTSSVALSAPNPGGAAVPAPPPPQDLFDQSRLTTVRDEIAAGRQHAAQRPARLARTVTTRVLTPQETRPGRHTRPVSAVSALASEVVRFALAQVGKPYVFAADGPDSYDCSGLAKAAYAQVGITIPHQTGGIVKLGRPVTRAELIPGDLVFPSSGHVGIYIGGDRMVHAPHPGDHVRVAAVYAFWKARRLL